MYENDLDWAVNAPIDEISDWCDAVVQEAEIDEHLEGR